MRRQDEKENRFKQKIENIKKEKKKTLQLTKRSNSEEKRTIVFSNEGCSDQHQQMMNPINNNEQRQLMNLHENNQENIMVNNEVKHDDQIPNISGAGINNDILVLLYSTYPDYGNNNYNFITIN